MAEKEKAEQGTLKRRIQLEAEIPELIKEIQDSTSVSKQAKMAVKLQKLLEELEAYYYDG